MAALSEQFQSSISRSTSTPMKMPVKVDSSRCRSPTPTSAFECDLLTEFEQELVNDCLSNVNFDDMWGNLTPPASPQIKLDFMDMNLENFLDDTDEMDFDQKSLLINHDCMWSGQCSQGHCNSSAYSSNKPASNSLSSSWTRPDSIPGSFNLSTSPVTNLLGDLTYSDFAGLESLSSFLDDDLTAPQPQLLHQQELQMQLQQQQQAQQSGNVFAGMANDHSYESSSPISIKEESEDEIVIKKESSLLTKNPIKVLHTGKITKIKCKKISGSAHKKAYENSSSLLNSNIIHRTSSNSLISNGQMKRETSVMKQPTLIQVSANFNNLANKMAIKKKKINIIHANDAKSKLTVSSTNVRPLIHIKKVSSSFTNGNHISSLISPSTSDSEESSVSGSSMGDDGRKSSPPFRRREHNDSERKRRDHLRNSFNNLKDQIPKLKSAEKRPPRIMILHEATNYVTSLINTNYNLEKTLEAELEKKKRLMSMLKSMQQDS